MINRVSSNLRVTGTAAVSLLAVSLLVIAAVGLTAAAQNEINTENSSTEYQWAELSDSSASTAYDIDGAARSDSEFAFVETSSNQMNHYQQEIEELRAAFDVAAIIQGHDFQDTDQYAAMLEMEMSSSLSPNASPADFFRFTRTHSRLYANEHAAAVAFATFKLNKKAVADMNAEFGITSESNAVFSARGPHALLTPAEFKKKILNAKNPRGRSRNKKTKISAATADTLKKKDSSSPKSRTLKPTSAPSASLQPVKIGSGRTAGAAGRGAGISGGTGGKSGKTGGQSGSIAGKSGKTGGQSGGTGGKSGKTGGKSGKTGGQSGQAGGKSGKTGGQSGQAGGKSGKTGGKSGKTGGDGGSTASKSGKTGGGGIVYSSVANGTKVDIALPGKSANGPAQFSTAIGYTDPVLAKSMGISRDQLKAQSLEIGKITDVSYDTYYLIMKDHHMIGRARSRLSGENNVWQPLEPVQLNDCGSCWAISVQQSLQRYWFYSWFKGVLSVQQLLDCARTVDSKGCKGGTPMDGLEFWATNRAAIEEDYPEKMIDQACKPPPYPNSPFAYPSGGWEMLVPECKDGDKLCHDQIKYELMVLKFTRQAGFQPPIVYVDASNWQFYAGGIFPPSKCSSTMEAGNHVVQIVGSGIDNLGIPYWIIDNSWGNEWGERGRIRLPWGVNACGLFNFQIFATPPPFYRPESVGGFNVLPSPYDPKPIDLKPVDTKSGKIVAKTVSLTVNGRRALGTEKKALMMDGNASAVKKNLKN